MLKVSNWVEKQRILDLCQCFGFSERKHQAKKSRAWIERLVLHPNVSWHNFWLTSRHFYLLHFSRFGVIPDKSRLFKKSVYNEFLMGMWKLFINFLVLRLTQMFRVCVILSWQIVLKAVHEIMCNTYAKILFC